MAKNILGLDLGTTSIGWALVSEAENDVEISSIKKVGVRVNPLSTDELTDFEKGNPITVNANRTLKRGARRNLDRYQKRRDNLISVLRNANLITNATILAEDEKDSTHSTYESRAKAAKEKVSKEEFARTLLMINKKRGYKSSRKAKNEDEGQTIDGMAIAKRLYDEGKTPGQLAYELLKEGKKHVPDFYRSDLQLELEKVWSTQKQFHPDILNDDFRKEIEGKGQRATSAIFWKTYNFNTAENKGTREQKKIQAYEWRSKAINEELDKEEVAFVITEINNNINNSSGYLGAISDRSKELYFHKQTVGEYLYKQLEENPHTKLKNQVFYRQDYLDEFETIWTIQSKYHPELTSDLKTEIRDIIIFYQRKLKSQKGLISFCEFESKEIIINVDGVRKTRNVGLRVSPKSSPLFQEFKIWQVLNNVKLQNKKTKEELVLSDDAKNTLFEELNIKGNLKADSVLKILGYDPKEWTLNHTELEGNRTNQVLYDVYLKILDLEGYDEDLLKLTNKDDISVNDLLTRSSEIKEMIRSIFELLNIDTSILEFDAELEGKAFEKQNSYQLWHLLYSYEEDGSPTGNDKLYELLESKFGFKKEYAQILANLSLAQDYCSLSAKATRKIFPYIKDSMYNIACAMAGYNHSTSLTKKENENRSLKDKLELLPKNSLRNPVVEKILNQVVNIVNAIIADPDLGKPDEIRIELARELKSSATERKETTSNINKAKSLHDDIRATLIYEDGIKNPTRNDIIRYKLYEELKNNGYKDLYTNTYIPREKLFSKEFDIEHIIPQMKVFDDSFSNKTIVPRHVNIDKGNKTAYDYISEKIGTTALEDYVERVEMMHKDNSIGRAKFQKLLKEEKNIGDNFIERDLRNSQYIAKKARQMLLEICKTVVPTTGNVTARLREDWGLINIMQELNMEKFRAANLTQMIEKKDGTSHERIIDWTKRNDHRHHAMDALTVAFTKHNHIQYLNYLNARRNEKHEKHKIIIAIQNKETELVYDDSGNRKRKFKSPIPNFRQEAKKHLESVLVSFKAKNKVVTKNKNRTKSKNGDLVKIELTPRGQLHEATLYGKIQKYSTKEELVGSKFDLETIKLVANKLHREALLNRLFENENDPKKAFSGKNAPTKNPIYLDDGKTISVPDKVKLVWLENNFTTRKNVDHELKIDKVIDVGIKRILQERLDRFNGNAKAAFSNLEKDPIWQNQEKGIAIKRVIISGVKNAETIAHKKDHHGNKLLDDNGKHIPADFISTGNNHHVAVYRDEKGTLQENVVSFFEAVMRVNQGLPIINKSFKKDEDWSFLFTMKQNEYFIFSSSDFDPNEVDLLDPKNYKLISENLFRVQSIAKKDYIFNHHLETIAAGSEVLKKKELSEITFRRIRTPKNLNGAIKIRINHIGQIVKVGEY